MSYDFSIYGVPEVFINKIRVPHSISKPDKGNGVVVLNRADYVAKIRVANNTKNKTYAGYK